MTKFIELTGVDDNINPKKFDVNISSISSIEESLLSDNTLIYANNGNYYVKESRQQIKDLIIEAEQENPYRTK